MSKRITVVLDDDVNKKLLLLQAKLITKTAKNKSESKPRLLSFSYVVNFTLRKELT